MSPDRIFGRRLESKAERALGALQHARQPAYSWQSMSRSKHVRRAMTRSGSARASATRRDEKGWTGQGAAGQATDREAWELLIS
jgi:hypothetical protein